MKTCEDCRFASNIYICCTHPKQSCYLHPMNIACEFFEPPGQWENRLFSMALISIISIVVLIILAIGGLLYN